MDKEQYLDKKYHRKTMQWNKIRTFFYGVFYKTLFKFGLGWKFNIWLCKNGKYKKFMDGRCMWCGENHLPELKTKVLDYEMDKV